MSEVFVDRVTGGREREVGRGKEGGRERERESERERGREGGRKREREEGGRGTDFVGYSVVCP